MRGRERSVAPAKQRLRWMGLLGGRCLPPARTLLYIFLSISKVCKRKNRGMRAGDLPGVTSNGRVSVFQVPVSYLWLQSLFLPRISSGLGAFLSVLPRLLIPCLGRTRSPGNTCLIQASCGQGIASPGISLCVLSLCWLDARSGRSDEISSSLAPS